MCAHIILAAAVLCAFGVQPAMAQRVAFEKTLDVAGISMLDVSTLRGKIRIVASEGNRVVVGGAATVRIGFAVPADAVNIAQRIATNPPIERAGIRCDCDLLRVRRSEAPSPSTTTSVYLRTSKS